MSLIIPVKCKLCGATIKPPELIIGEDPRIPLLKQIAKMAAHMAKRAEDEARNGGLTKPHLEAFAQQQGQAQNLAGVLMSRCFDLSPELEAYAERERAMLARTLRKATVTDEEIQEISISTLNAVMEQFEDRPYVELLQHLKAAVKDLRDRYEELGDYAPAEVPTTATPGDDAATVTTRHT